MATGAGGKELSGMRREERGRKRRSGGEGQSFMDSRAVGHEKRGEGKKEEKWWGRSELYGHRAVGHEKRGEGHLREGHSTPFLDSS